MVITKKKYNNNNTKYSKKLFNDNNVNFNGGAAIPKVTTKMNNAKTVAKVAAKGIGAAAISTVHAATTKLPHIAFGAVKSAITSPVYIPKLLYQSAKALKGYFGKGKKTLKQKETYEEIKSKLTELNQKFKKGRDSKVISTDLSAEQKKAVGDLRTYIETLQNKKSKDIKYTQLISGINVSTGTKTPSELLAELKTQYEQVKQNYNDELKTTNKNYENATKIKNAIQYLYNQTKKDYNTLIDKKKFYEAKLSEGLIQQLSEVRRKDYENTLKKIQKSLLTTAPMLKQHELNLQKASNALRKQNKKTFEGSAASRQRQWNRLKSTASTVFAPLVEIGKEYEKTYKNLDDPKTGIIKSVGKALFTLPDDYTESLQAPFRSLTLKQPFDKYVSKSGASPFKAKGLRSTKSLFSNITTLGDGLIRQNAANVNTTKTRQELENIKSEFIKRQNKYTELEMEKEFLANKYGLPYQNYNQFKSFLKYMKPSDRKKYIKEMKDPKQYEVLKKIHQRINAEDAIKKINTYLNPISAKDAIRRVNFLNNNSNS
jgi:hypothetical protein